MQNFYCYVTIPSESLSFDEIPPVKRVYFQLTDEQVKLLQNENGAIGPKFHDMLFSPGNPEIQAIPEADKAEIYNAFTAAISSAFADEERQGLLKRDAAGELIAKLVSGPVSVERETADFLDRLIKTISAGNSNWRKVEDPEEMAGLLKDQFSASDSTVKFALQMYKQYTQTPGKPAGELPVISVKASKPDTLIIPVDQVNNAIWKGIDEPENGKVDLRIKAEKLGDPPVDIYFSLILTPEFAEKYNIPALAALTQEDKRFFLIADSIVRAGNEYTSPNTIYKMLTGGTRGLGKDRLGDYSKTLLKLNSSICLDNSQEIELGYKYERWNANYHFQILPNEWVPLQQPIVINGKRVQDPIRFFSPSRLMDFAISRGMVASVPLEAIQLKQPSELKLRLNDYLLNFILRASRNKRYGTVRSFSTLFQKVQSTDKMEHSRIINTYAPERLETWKQCGLLLDYQIDKKNKRIVIEPVLRTGISINPKNAIKNAK